MTEQNQQENIIIGGIYNNFTRVTYSEALWPEIKTFADDAPFFNDWPEEDRKRVQSDHAKNLKVL
jgi:hypothetical protein